MYNKYKKHKLFRNINYIERLKKNRKGRKKLGNLINSVLDRLCAKGECSCILLADGREKYGCDNCLIDLCYIENNELFCYPEKFE